MFKGLVFSKSPVVRARGRATAIQSSSTTTCSLGRNSWIWTKRDPGSSKRTTRTRKPHHCPKTSKTNRQKRNSAPCSPARIFKVKGREGHSNVQGFGFSLLATLVYASGGNRGPYRHPAWASPHRVRCCKGTHPSYPVALIIIHLLSW